MAGCAVVSWMKRATIVVAGGEDANGQKLNTVEFLHYTKVKYNLVRSFWKKYDSLKYARSHFPSVGMVDGNLTVAGGKLDHPEFNPLVEQFNGTNWNIVQDLKLQSPRFGHSTLKIDKDWCN